MVSSKVNIQILTVSGVACVEIKTRTYYAAASGRSRGFPWLTILKCLLKILKLTIVAEGYEDDKGFHFTNYEKRLR